MNILQERASSISMKHCIKFYHELLYTEAHKISNVPMTDRVEERILKIMNPEYCLTYDDLIRIARNVDKNNTEAIVNELIRKGYIVKVDDNCFRSFHFDLLLRLSDIRLHPRDSRRVLSSRFGIASIPMTSKEHKNILPVKDGSCKLCNELYEAIRNYLEDDSIVKAVTNTIKRYFELKNSRGFDPYQATAIIRALKAFDKDGYVIIAPTGSGKTEVFLTLGIVFLLKELTAKKDSKMMLIYPRKMLEIDQMSRIISLIEILNDELRKTCKNNPLSIKVYLRDGDTHELTQKFDDMKQGESIEFRGISCEQDGKLYLEKSINDKPKVVCRKDEKIIKEYDFVAPIRSIPEAKDANIIITTWNTLMYRLSALELKNYDIDLYDVIKTSILVLDEAHEYDSISSAVMSYIIAILRELAKKHEGRKLRVIISTATLPDPVEYAATLINTDKRNVLDLSFDSLSKEIDNFEKIYDLKRLIITLIVQMLPKTSWITYLAEALSLQMFLYYAYKETGKEFLPQSIVFINNVRELNRAKTVLENQLSLGSPLDNLCIRRYKCEDLNPKEYRHVFSHYLNLNTDNAFQNRIKIHINSFDNKNNANLYDFLARLYDIVFSKVDLSSRSTIYEKMLRGELATILATSSLELGMDYSFVSLIFNAGFDKLESLIQRFGRGGRSDKTLYTTLAVQITRNNPLDYRFFSSPNTIKSIIAQSMKGAKKKRIPKDLLAVKTRVLLNLAFILLLLSETSQSGTRRLRKESDLISLLKELRKIIKTKDFIEIATNTGLLSKDANREDIDKIFGQLISYYENKKYLVIYHVDENRPDRYIATEIKAEIIRTLKKLIEEDMENAKNIIETAFENKEYYKEKLEKLRKVKNEFSNKLSEFEKKYFMFHNYLDDLVNTLYSIYLDEKEINKQVEEITRKLNRNIDELREIKAELENMFQEMHRLLTSISNRIDSRCREYPESEYCDFYDKLGEKLEIINENLNKMRDTTEGLSLYFRNIKKTLDKR